MIIIGHITIDYMENPMGITSPPQLGWIIKSDKENVIQKTYHLKIALDEDFREIIYDSGVVESSESAHIVINELKLKSSTKYYVKVKISDGSDESEWSELAYFMTGIIDNSEWLGKFVSAETKNDGSSSKGTYVRTNFNARSDIESAVVHTTALGLYKLYINGEKVGKDELAPGWTSYKKHLLYQTHDVTHLIVTGENSMGASLGAGWYKGLMGFFNIRNHYGDRTAFLCQLEIIYSDGTRDLIITDESWKGNNSPIMFSEIYDGEIYDARREIDNWHMQGFDDSDWRQVETVEFCKDVLTAQPGSRVTQVEEIKPKKIIETPEGDTVIDFGQILSGWIDFKVKGKSGDKVILKHFEVLDSKGDVYIENLRTAKQTIDYTLRGEKEESYHPSFTFQGFRYVKVEQYPGKVMLDNFKAIVVHSKMEQTGTFESSNHDINQLHHNILWGLKGNFVDIPMDCPQRDERLGWTGDAQIFARTACYIKNTYQFFKKWLRDVKADQTPEGGIGHIVPDILSGTEGDNWLLSKGTHSSAAWADVAVIAPWTIYLTFGDKKILEDQYDSMRAWIDFMDKHSENGLWHYGLQFGDWVALDAKEGSSFGATPTELVASAYFAYSTNLFSKAAKVLGRDDDYKKYSKLHNQIVKGFQREFYTPTGRLAARTQTAHILTLYFDLVPEKFKERTENTLIELLDEQDGHLVTGFVGTPYFCHALSQNGRTKEAFDLLLKDDYPSWLYQVKMGATTIWEHWDGIKPDGSMWSPDMNSFNHYAYGAIGEWLYRVVAGIEVDEKEAGFKHSIINPHIGGDLNYVKASYKSIYGDIVVKWQVDGDIVKLNITIPHNTTSTIMLDNASSIIYDGGYEFTNTEKGLSTKVGSGNYQFTYSI